MKISSHLLPSKHTELQTLYEDASFKMVSTLLTEVLGKKCDQVLVSAKAGDFIHDHTTAIESGETAHLSVTNANVVERERVTEIMIDGSIRRKNRFNNRFSIYFSMKRQFLIIPNPLKQCEKTDKSCKNHNVFGITGTLYNSIFSLNLKGVDRRNCQYPLGIGRGYLIFDETQRD